MGYAGNGNGSASPVFNRSVSIHSTSAASVGSEQKRPSYNIYNFSKFHRNGSVKNFNTASSAGSSLHGKVKKLCSLFEPHRRQPSEPPTSYSLPMLWPSSPKSQKSATNSPKFNPTPTLTPIPKNISSLFFESPIKLPGTEDRVVVYFTSLRGIRRTFQDCHSVRMIFRGFRVNIDERDLSMDVAYRRELQRLLGQWNLTLPQVFIKGSYIGGAELIKQLAETGDLAKLIRGLPTRPMKPCDVCDDIRFIPCTVCDGSCKVFDEDDDEPTRCSECNENGLLRCPLCCQ